MIVTRQGRLIPAFLARHRATLVVALVAVLAASGTAVAVSYLVLGSTNTSGGTTTLKSGVNGAVLQLTDTNGSGGTGARGLGITVPAGRPPMTVNSGVKVTNLNADKLDGIDSSAFARGTNVVTLANRRVLANGAAGVVLLVLPGLGQLKGDCGPGTTQAFVTWWNTTSASIDVWTNAWSDGRLRAAIAAPASAYSVATWDAAEAFQYGDTLELGRGNDPGARRTASVNLAAYRSNTGAPCGLDATATLWSTP